MKVEIQTCDGCGIEHPGDAGWGSTGMPTMPNAGWMGVIFGHRGHLALGINQDLYVCSLDCPMVAARKLRGFTVDPVVDPLEMVFAAPAVEPVRKPRATRKPRPTTK